MPSLSQTSHTYRRTLTLVAAGLVALVFTGCETFDDIFGDDDAPAAQRNAHDANPQYTQTNNSTSAVQAQRYSHTIGDTDSPTFSETLTDKRLKQIYERQEVIFADIQSNPTKRDEVEYERRLQTIATAYESLLLDNENYAYGYLLYGKFLRRTGNPRAANNAFMKANMLDPNMAVAKQQIGNFLAEEGEYGYALPYYLAAIEISPDTALYRYQVGELLHRYRHLYISSNAFDQATLDRNMLAAFRAAVELAPDNAQYRQRYAEAFFDVEEADWEQALIQWNYLVAQAETPLTHDLIELQRARVLIKLGRPEEARSILSTINRPSLMEAKAELESEL